MSDDTHAWRDLAVTAFPALKLLNGGITLGISVCSRPGCQVITTPCGSASFFKPIRVEKLPAELAVDPEESSAATEHVIGNKTYATHATGCFEEVASASTCSAAPASTRQFRFGASTEPFWALLALIGEAGSTDAVGDRDPSRVLARWPPAAGLSPERRNLLAPPGSPFAIALQFARSAVDVLALMVPMSKSSLEPTTLQVRTARSSTWHDDVIVSFTNRDVGEVALLRMLGTIGESVSPFLHRLFLEEMPSAAAQQLTDLVTRRWSLPEPGTASSPTISEVILPLEFGSEDRHSASKFHILVGLSMALAVSRHAPSATDWESRFWRWFRDAIRTVADEERKLRKAAEAFTPTTVDRIPKAPGLGSASPALPGATSAHAPAKVTAAPPPSTGSAAPVPPTRTSDRNPAAARPRGGSKRSRSRKPLRFVE